MPRLLIASLIVALSVSEAFAADLDPTEIQSITDFCNQSSRDSAAKQTCLRAQTDKLAQGKQIEADTARAEARTRAELNIPDPAPSKP